MPDDTREPDALVASELFALDATAARRLWRDGFRPRHAEDLRPGVLVVYTQTDPLAGQPYGDPVVGRVEEVERDRFGGIHVQHHPGIVTEADEWDEVWTKQPEPEPRL